MAETLPKLASPLPPLLPRLELEPPALSLLDGLPTAAEGILKLEAAGLRNEAARLAAHALPKREAVWWGCMCARAVPDPALLPVDADALLAAEAWVRKPNEETLRRAAMEAAQRTAFRSPEAWAAVGAFWSGGSMAPAGQPVVPPPDHLTGVAVSGGVVLAAVRLRPERAQDRLARFLVAARDIAAGGAGRIAPEES
ncbi:hypothetical protein G3576_07495 [Roseomonas stagni]|uniref:Uncharacterized protein n=1 Tax=Falsiroseomonas algicola TaxID=2716930 RepID=A0A6M1LHL7_9PROT|nr:hypothetical protein [Falsiroseomonas algicola]NGM19855.1 hypothetical protein [Falsiroseomonas algicola]